MTRRQIIKALCAAAFGITGKAVDLSDVSAALVAHGPIELRLVTGVDASRGLSYSRTLTFEVDGGQLKLMKVSTESPQRPCC